MSAPSRRRWFQFSLRGLLIGVTVLSLWLGWQVYIVNKRKAFLESAVSSGGRWTARDAMNVPGAIPQAQITEISWHRKLLGDQAVSFIELPTATNDELSSARSLFPESRVGSGNGAAPAMPNPRYAPATKAAAKSGKEF